MHELCRTVRFCINDEPFEASAARPRRNSFAGWPAMRGFGRFYELEVHCQGQPDTASGYVMNVAHVDEAVRLHALPIIARAIANDPASSPAWLLPVILARINAVIDAEVTLLRWWLTPYHALAMQRDHPDEILLSDTFDFAAAHRLHCADLSQEQNRALFGKCNNPNGHGHNYRLRPVVAVPLERLTSSALGLEQIQQIVQEQILQRFDHKHLNEDVPEFAELNPSVEHITRICFDLLREPVRAAGGRLVEVTVWETEKTCCTYRG